MKNGGFLSFWYRLIDPTPRDVKITSNITYTIGILMELLSLFNFHLGCKIDAKC